HAGIPIENLQWSLDNEQDHFAHLDIGVYPLPNDTWSRGKAAFKAIQYMTAGVPVVASPVGMNCEVVEDGVSGFLAGSEEEWVEKLSWLCSDAALRRRLGEAGRKKIEAAYSLNVYQERLLDLIRNQTCHKRQD
ncbi:MAG: glycosyltransferase family 4 protein, partial [Candidatus Omnitrophota bacterium]